MMNTDLLISKSIQILDNMWLSSIQNIEGNGGRDKWWRLEKPNFFMDVCNICKFFCVSKSKEIQPSMKNNWNLTIFKRNRTFFSLFFVLYSKNRLEALSQFCYFAGIMFWNDEPVPQNASIYDTIGRVSPDLSSVIYERKTFWVDSQELVKFGPIFTDEGLCFTANSINSREMYTDEWVW